MIPTPTAGLGLLLTVCALGLALRLGCAAADEPAQVKASDRANALRARDLNGAVPSPWAWSHERHFAATASVHRQTFLST